MKEYRIIWTKKPQKDLEEIIEYIKISNIQNAKKVFFEIKEKCEKLYYFPLKYRIVPELQQIGINKYRELIYKRWRIIYKIEKQTVYILIVADTSRNLEDLLLQRLLRE